jgi:hypothetical protein
MPALILKPLVMAAVDMQHHAWQGTTLTALAVDASLRLPPHQAGALQCLIHPGVAQADLMLLRQLLVEVAHVQIEVLLPV